MSLRRPGVEGRSSRSRRTNGLALKDAESLAGQATYCKLRDATVPTAHAKEETWALRCRDFGNARHGEVRYVVR